MFEGRELVFNKGIIVDRDINAVWDYFTKASEWKNWYGGAIESVEWKEGGTITWALGAPSTITLFIPHVAVVTMDRSFAKAEKAFLFQQRENKTFFVIQEPENKNLSFSNYAAYEESMEKLLRDFAYAVES